MEYDAVHYPFAQVAISARDLSDECSCGQECDHEFAAKMGEKVISLIEEALAVLDKFPRY